ncbi:hypothetical protein CK203_117764 [Vitis vinifera]|uniref:Retrotransposon gag domain-containing protein n=1 Tax=Vitis vinifera TaxID=29760 RepID=A0A438D0T9_VITVI|nr:hypothetical protein CK203_117764 [Vitis vinifera]
MEKDICIIETWEDFKREIKSQFYPENVAYLARKNMRHFKHKGSIRDYVKEFFSLKLEIPNITGEELLFNFMDNLQGWAKEKLRHQGVQDLATTMAVVESFTDYKMQDDFQSGNHKDKSSQGEIMKKKTTSRSVFQDPSFIRSLCFKLKNLVVEPKNDSSVEPDEELVDRKLNRSRSGSAHNSTSRGPSRPPGQLVEGAKTFSFFQTSCSTGQG